MRRSLPASYGRSLVRGQEEDGGAAGGVEGADGGERQVAEIDPGVERGRRVGADPDRPAGERYRGRAVPIARDGHDLREVRGEPQHIEGAEGDGDEIDPADAHGALSGPLRVDATGIDPKRDATGAHR
jgi:hypothetical protein